MKQALELFVATSGWTYTSGLYPLSLCQHRDYIADDLPASLLCRVPAGKSGVGMSRALSLTLPAGYDELVFHVWSRRMQGSQYARAADFPYKVSLDGATYYLVPCYRGFGEVSIRGVAPAVTRVEVVPNHNVEDWVVLSAMYAVRDEQPLDLMGAVVAGLQQQVDALVGDTIAIGTVTCAAGAGTLSMAAPPWVDRYAVVKISGGGHSELHQIEIQDEAAWKFMSTFDGPATLWAYSGAAVTLYVPVRTGSPEREIALPGISVWTMGPNPVPRQSGVERDLDSWDGANAAKDSRQRENLMYQVLIDCEARQHELLALVSRCAKRFLGRNVLWINGRRHDFEWTLQSEYVEPELPVEVIPKVQFTLEVEVKEPREAPVTLAPVTKVTTTIGMGVS